MESYRKNRTNKIQIVRYDNTKKITVEPNDYIKSDKVAAFPNFDIFDRGVEMDSLSTTIEKRDVNGNVIRIISDFVIDTSTPVKEQKNVSKVVSIIIPVFGKHEYLHLCIQKIHDTVTLPYEIIIVNDEPGSTIEFLHDSITVITNEKNVGFGASCNIGAKVASGSFLCFLNSDVTVESNWLERLIKTSQRFASGVVGGRLLYPGSNKIQHSGMEYTEEDGLFVHTNKNVNKSEQAISKHAQAVSGAMMLIERSAWDLLDGFDEGFGKGYFEDVDLCLRWIDLGGRVAYCGGTDCHHFENTSQKVSKSVFRRTLLQGAEVFKDRWPPQRIQSVLRGYPSKVRVDIVLPVYNSLRTTANCIKSIQLHTPDWISYKLLIVNDGSCQFVTDWLRDIAKNDNKIELIEQENKGYLSAIQNGTEHSNSPWICYMNSDVIVTDGWLGKLIRTAETDDKIGMVNPCTNAAAHCSIDMPAGSNYIDTNERFALYSELRRYELVTPVGFCLLMRRKILDDCGGWDLKYYGRGYGEETDLYMQLREHGYRSAVSDDCFVLHESGKSHSLVGDKPKLERDGYNRFMDRWQNKVNPLLREFNKEAPYRYFLPVLHNLETNRKKIVFVFRDATLCGGVLAVVNICNQLIDLGWDATFACNRISNKDKMGLRFEPYVFPDRRSLIKNIRKICHDTEIVATIWTTAVDVLEICSERDDLRPSYFIQDVEYMFTFPNGKPYTNQNDVVETYGMINKKVVNSQWVLDTMKEHGYDAHKICVGVDPLIFHPRKKNDVFTVMAHCRPSTPRRGWPFIRDVFRNVKSVLGNDVKLIVYDQDPGKIHEIESMGRIAPYNLAEEMGKADVFVEGSTFQGFGLQALEAMASGCALISTNNGGIDNYGTNNFDCLLVEHGDIESTVNMILRLKDDSDLRQRLIANGRNTAVRFAWSAIANEWSKFLKS